MQQEEITAIFDRQAASYDQQWSKLASINEALHLLMGPMFSALSPKAHFLCVGAGTGGEIIYLARRFPGWRFTAVEPSIAMLEVFRGKAKEHGILERCILHAGYLDSLPEGATFDGATAFLVSQFILDRGQRVAFFRGITHRLRPNGVLVSSDLAADMDGVDAWRLLELWFQLMSDGGIPPEGVARMREAYSRDVAVIPPGDVQDIISEGGFESPMHFFQAGMIHAWSAKRSSCASERAGPYSG